MSPNARSLKLLRAITNLMGSLFAVARVIFGSATLFLWSLQLRRPGKLARFARAAVSGDYPIRVDEDCWYRRRVRLGYAVFPGAYSRSTMSICPSRIARTNKVAVE